MKTETKTTIETILNADGSLSDSEREVITKALAGGNTRRRMGTARQAAEILGVHPRTVHRYARMGLLHPARQTARRIRFDLEEVSRLSTEGVVDR
ncbi:MAG: helix-turn-helix domain-containing protein [Verrucomicrobia bacterium]|nr:helix-turn-helix domain-containing protein [Verrucomicrobiota bacterium]